MVTEENDLPEDFFTIDGDTPTWGDGDDALYDKLRAILQEGNYPANEIIGTLCHLLCSMLAGNPDRPPARAVHLDAVKCTLATISQLQTLYYLQNVLAADPPESQKDENVH